MGARKKIAQKQQCNSKVPEALREHAWKPGQSGNPGGRPRGVKSLTHELMHALDKPVKVNQPLAKLAENMGLDIERVTVRELLIYSTLVHAMKGQASVLQHVWDRIDGKVAERIAGHDGGPLQDNLTRVMTDPRAMAAARALAKELSVRGGEENNGGSEVRSDPSGDTPSSGPPVDIEPEEP